MEKEHILQMIAKYIDEKADRYFEIEGTASEPKHELDEVEAIAGSFTLSELQLPPSAILKSMFANNSDIYNLDENDVFNEIEIAVCAAGEEAILKKLRKYYDDNPKQRPVSRDYNPFLTMSLNI